MTYSLIKKWAGPFLVILLLSPLAQLLRTQQPWTCFHLTFDENYYSQAIYNEQQGKGFRLHSQNKLFDPMLTVGPPMAWGTSLVQKLSPRADLPQAGRTWVWLNFWAILILLSIWSWKRAKTVSSAIITITVFGFIIAKYPAAPYLTYGILGEIPGALISWIALLLLNTTFYPAAPLIAVFAAFTKITYLPLAGAVFIATLIHRGLSKKSILSTIAGYVGLIGLAAYARNETIVEYLKVFNAASYNISTQGSLTDSLTFLWNNKISITIPSLIAALIGGKLLTDHFKKRPNQNNPLLPAETAAFIFFGIGLIMYFVLRRLPQPKHWFVFFNLAAGVLAVRIGLICSPWISRRIQNETTLAAIFITTAATWALNVPSLNYRIFRSTPDDSCVVKQQRVIARKLQELNNKGALNPNNLLLVTDPSSSLFVYELGWTPNEITDKQQIEKIRYPQWIVATTSMLTTPPNGCTTTWKGDSLALYECTAK